MSRHVEKLGSAHKMPIYQVTVLGRDPVAVLEIGTILLHFNGRNFLIEVIPYPSLLESWLTPHF